MNGLAAVRPAGHSRQSSASSARPLSAYQIEKDGGSSYVQQLRMTQATVWSGRGPKDAVNVQRKIKPHSSGKKGRFGMKLFQAPGLGSNGKPIKTKLRLYAAPEHTTLVPRLSATEANDNDDEFDNFTSTAPPAVDKRINKSPSIGTRSSFHLANTTTTSRANSMHNAEFSGPPSPAQKPARMDSVASSNAASSMREPDELFTTRMHGRSQSQFQIPSGFTTSRSGSPTQLQQYTTQHIPSDSDDEDHPRVEQKLKLFIANADVEDDSD